MPQATQDFTLPRSISEMPHGPERDRRIHGFLSGQLSEFLDGFTAFRVETHMAVARLTVSLRLPSDHPDAALSAACTTAEAASHLLRLAEAPRAAEDQGDLFTEAAMDRWLAAVEAVGQARAETTQGMALKAACALAAFRQAREIATGDALWVAETMLRALAENAAAVAVLKAN